MEKLRLGIIGCGGMANNHEDGVAQLQDKIEVTAVCDVVRERAEKAGEILKADFVTTDYREMVDYVDAVLVVLPHDLHYECGMFFIRHKKHVLMEKPLCNSEEECLRLIQASEEENVTLMTAYPVRYWPGVVKLKEFVDSGEYGEAFQMSIWTEQYTRAPEGTWSTSARLGGGQFFSHGCHYVDILLWFFGDPEKGIHLGTNKGTPWMLKEGTSNAVIVFKNGKMGYHFGTWGAHGSKMGYDFQVICEKGTLEYDHFAGEVRLFQCDDLDTYGAQTELKPKKILWKRDGGKSKYTQNELLEFADCIRNHRKPATDAYTSLQGLRVIWKMYDAEAHNQLADLSDIHLEEQ